MAYSSITLDVPPSASADETVTAKVTITNLTSHSIYGQPVLRGNGAWIGEGAYDVITPDQPKVWNIAFTMPNQRLTVVAESWIETPAPYNIPWHLDASVQQVIELAAPASEFHDFAISDYSRV